MDRAINSTGQFEQYVEKKEEEVQIEPQENSSPGDKKLPRRVLPVYRTGDVTKGTLRLKLKKSMRADSVSIRLRCQAVVNISNPSKFGPHDNRAAERYVDKNIVVWKKSENENAASDVVVEEATPAQSELLPEGWSSWPFQFTIPDDSPPSVPNLAPGADNYCYILHRLRGKLTKGRGIRGREVVTYKALWVEPPYDIADDPQNLEPITACETLDTGLLLKSGKLSVKADLAKKGFVKGKAIPIKLEIDNQTSGQIKKVTAGLMLQGSYRLEESPTALSKTISISSTRVKVENVSSGMAPVLNWLLPWDFSRSSVDGNLLPVGTLTVCKLITVRYVIIIKVKRGGMHRNMQLEIPIVVGNVDS